MLNYNNLIKRALVLCTIFSLCLVATAQQIKVIPSLMVFHSAIDDFYMKKNIADKNIVQESKRYRYLSFLPSPSYSPFTGGFSLNSNLSAILTEIRKRHFDKQNIKAIEARNDSARRSLINEVSSLYFGVQAMMQANMDQSKTDSLVLVQYQLFESKYANNQIQPTEFLSLQKSYQDYQQNRTAQRTAIHLAVINLFLKSKMDVVTATSKYSNHN
jgi:hypothetical protein